MLLLTGCLLALLAAVPPASGTLAFPGGHEHLQGERSGRRILELSSANARALADHLEFRYGIDVLVLSETQVLVDAGSGDHAVIFNDATFYDDSTARTTVIPLHGVSADVIRGALQARFANTSYVEDRERRTLVVTAPGPTLLEIQNLVRELNVNRTIEYFVYFRDIDQTVRAIQSHFAPAAITSDRKTNTIWITGNPTVLAEIGRFLADVDRQPATILVEGLIVQLNHKKLEDYGAKFTHSYSQTATQLNDANRLEPSTRTSQTSGSMNFLATTLPNYLWKWQTPNGKVYEASIGALVEEGIGTVIMRPHMTFLSGDEATFVQGDRLPHVTTSQNGTNVSFTDATLELRIGGVAIPIARREGDTGPSWRILVQKLFLKDDDKGDQVAGGGNIAYLSTRLEMSTTQLVDDGELFVVGGTINHTDRATIKRIPILGSIPLLGHLFRSTDIDNETIETVGFLKLTVLDRRDAFREWDRVGLEGDARPPRFERVIGALLREHPVETAKWSSTEIYARPRGYFDRIHGRYDETRMTSIDDVFRRRIRARLSILEEFEDRRLLEDSVLRDADLKRAFLEAAAEAGTSPRDMLLIARHLGTLNDHLYLTYDRFLSTHGINR